MSVYEFTVADRDEIAEIPRATVSELTATAELEPIRIANVLRLLQAAALRERAISVTIEVDESLYVNVDEAQLTLAVGKLLQKAIRSAAAGAHVVMRSRADEAGVVIEVDDGCGCTTSLVFPPARPTRISSWPPSHR